MSRVAVRLQLQRHFPALLPYFDARYGLHTRLSLVGAPADVALTSRTGVQQGDPLGPFFFALGLAAATDLAWPTPAPATHDDAAPPASALLRPFYLDDGTIVGPLPAVVEAANKLVAACSDAHTNLRINAKKCVLWSPTVTPADRRA